MARNDLVRATKIAGKGTGYVAAQAICEGKIVGEEEPFAYAVADDSLKTVCHECFKTSKRLHRCSQCHFAYYCDKSCQRAAWKMHKSECHRFKIGGWKPEEINEDIRLLGRMIDKITMLKKKKEKSPIDHLLSNLNCFDPETLCLEKGEEIRRRTYSNLQIYMNCTIDIDFFDKLVGKLRRNAFRLGNRCCTGFCASALFPKFALFNHSCRPNVCIFNVGTTSLARALVPICPGEELTINYVKHLMAEPIEHRRKRLRVQYLFNCTCLGCTSEGALEKDKLHTSLHTSLPEMAQADVNQCIEESKNVQRRAEYEMAAKNYEGALSILEKFIKSSPLDRRSWYITKPASLATKCCSELESCEKAIAFSHIEIDAFKTFSPNSMSLAVLYFSLVGIYIVMGNRCQAEDFAQKAVEICRINMGEHHPVTQCINPTDVLCYFINHI